MKMRHTGMAIALAAAGLWMMASQIAAQPPGRGAARVARSPREAAPIDLTGYWVSVISEDWRWRMVTPAKDDFAAIPFTPEGRKAGDTWDPAKDEASGDTCKAYGIASIMRLPGRLHITWQDDATLKIETDTGMQIRLVHFGQTVPDGVQATRQGFTLAHWEGPARGFGAPRPGFGATRDGTQGRALEATTTHLLPGYLRKNGFPVSGNAVVKEDFDLFTERSGQPWFVVTTIVEDPAYLQEPYVTSSNFKKQSDATHWNPRPCSAR